MADGGAVKLPKAARVKNKQPAEQQITAEQILREARELQEKDYKPPRQVITDPGELAEYRLRKRKEFEDTIRRVGAWNPGAWTKYAQWEEAQKDYRRARSVWERCLSKGANSRNPALWQKYVEMEMRGKFVNYARNVWDRAVTLLPRVDVLWHKYIHMEEMLGNIPGARQVYERWMKWEPDHQPWASYINFELRYKETDRAREIFERYVLCLPSVRAWVKYAKFEYAVGEIPLARRCYERALEDLAEEETSMELYIKFADFEQMVKEPERARAIYKYALDHLPKDQASEVYNKYLAFERSQGDRGAIEDAVVGERRFQYEAEVRENPLNYDSWFEYIRLEEAAGNADKIREVYERAVSNVPPAPEKRFWQRYIFLWVKYALWEELDAGDPERAREVYRACLKLLPHSSFTFAKVWLLAAQLELRQLRLDAARKILGMALGMCPKNKLFKGYINIELQLGNIDRCRTLYEKFLLHNPANCAAWCKFAELEASLNEAERARALYELAIQQPVLDMPELLWKAYIDFEITQGEREHARALYERLLERTKHVKVWMSYAKFEATPLELLATEQDEEGERRDVPAETSETPQEVAARESYARSVYERAYRSLRETQPDAKEEALALLEAWKEFESSAASRNEEERHKAVEAITRRLPKRVKRKRPIRLEDGSSAGMEEYYDYIFPEEEDAAPKLKILEAAYRWKRQKQDS